MVLLFIVVGVVLVRVVVEFRDRVDRIIIVRVLIFILFFF